MRIPILKSPSSLGIPIIGKKPPRVSTLARPSLSRDHHLPKTDVFRSYTRQGIDGDHSRHRYPPDQRLADCIYAVLIKHFPNHLWRVEASHAQGVATIRLMGMSDVPHVLKIEDLKLLSAEQDVMRAGGELLERFRMPTSGFTEAHFQAAVRQFKPHLTRRKHPDLIGAR